jgi:hypothetical protein
LLSGLAFGGLHHLLTPSEKAAVAALNNAKHHEQDTAPGIPADIAARAAHSRAMDTATEQALRGEPVNVSPDVTGVTFHPRENQGMPVPEDLQALDALREADSVKTDAAAEGDGYDVAEGVLTDEQLAQFEGLRAGPTSRPKAGRTWRASTRRTRESK